MKKTIWIVIVVIIIILIIVFASKSSQTPSTSTASDQTASDTSASSTASSTPVAATTVTVTYSDAGFSPKTISINNGDSVTWLNSSSGRLWVASDPHPTHTDLPGFDEKAAINKGGSWTYTFVVSGSHGYHNHANHTMTGTVVVK